MSSDQLDDVIHRKICELCAQGDRLVDDCEFEKAFYCYRDALNLVPEPVENWEATAWILAGIGDIYWLETKYGNAIQVFEDAVRCPGGLGNPFIHLRIGQCCFELEMSDRAADELTRAYMREGRNIFETEDPKYLHFLESRLKPPIGQSHI